MKGLLTIFLAMFVGSVSAQTGFKGVKTGNPGTSEPMVVNQSLVAKTAQNFTLWGNMDTCAGVQGGIIMLRNANSQGVPKGYFVGTSDTIQTVVQGTPIVVYNAEIAQGFSFSGTAQLTEVFLWPGAVNIVGSPDNFEVYAHQGGPIGGPGNILETVGFSSSDLVPGTSSNTILNPANHFPFATTPVVTDTFMIGVLVHTPLTDDTLGFASTNYTKPCSQDGVANFWVRQDIYDITGVNFLLSVWANVLELQQVDIDAIFAAVLSPMTATEAIKKGDLGIYQAYPNPSCNQTNLRYELAKTGTVNIKIFDIQGRTISQESFQAPAGYHEYPIQVTDYNAGTYFYTIKTENGTLTSKFSVSK